MHHLSTDTLVMTWSGGCSTRSMHSIVYTHVLSLIRKPCSSATDPRLPLVDLYIGDRPSVLLPSVLVLGGDRVHLQ